MPVKMVINARNLLGFMIIIDFYTLLLLIKRLYALDGTFDFKAW
jgi:hypothetical protein